MDTKEDELWILGIYSLQWHSSFLLLYRPFEKTRKMLMCSAWWRSETCNATWQMRPGIINCQFVIWDPGFLETGDLVLGKSTWLSYFMLEHPQSQEKIPRRIIIRISIMLSKKLLTVISRIKTSSSFHQFSSISLAKQVNHDLGIRHCVDLHDVAIATKGRGQGNSFTTATMSRNGSNTNQLDQCELTMSQCSYLLYFMGFSGCNHFFNLGVCWFICLRCVNYIYWQHRCIQSLLIMRLNWIKVKGW